jgi:ANTAR domain
VTGERDLQAAESLSRDELLALLEKTRLKVAQLEGALESRVAVEQAKGILAERLGLSIDEAFLLLRYAARASRSTLRELARAVVREPRTPAAVVIALSRQERWRAALMRERAEAQRERAARFFEMPSARRDTDSIA